MRLVRSKRPVAPLVVLLAGCSVPSEGAGRRHVQEQINARLGQSVATAIDGDGRTAIRRILDDGVLGADEAVRLAVANNRKLQSILEDLEIARAELWQASLPPNPVADAEIQFVEAGGGDLLELGVAQSIIDILLIPRRRQVATERFESVKASVTAAVLDLATEVRAAYRGLQAQRELVELFRSATDATYFSFDAARRLREAGNIIELDVLQERALYEDAKIALVEAQAMARKHRENLNVLMGIWGPDGESWTVQPRLPEPTELKAGAGDLESEVLTASLDLEAMRHGIVALGHEVGLKRLEVMFPEGAVGVTAEREAGETWSAGPLTSLSIPVFDFGQAASAEARARLRRAYERFTDFAVRIRRSARTAFVESETAGNNSRYLREVILPLRAQITEQTQRQFNAMQLGVFQLLQIRRRQIDAGRRYVETLRNHWIARTRLEALLLGRLPQQRFGIADPGGGSMAAMANNGDSGGH